MKKFLTSIVVAGLLATNSFAADAKTNEVSKNAVVKAQQKAQTDTKLIKGAIKAIQYTQDALIYLNGKDAKKAKESLKKAIAELSDVLNTPNAPYLLPIDMNIEAYEFQGKISDVKRLVEKTKELVEENKLPAARQILNSLRSEIDVNVVNLPLATYPAAVNLAIKYLNENKIKEAQDVLNMALNTLVEIEQIIPIPIVKAQSLITQASKLKDNKEKIQYLKEAENQLKLAKILGYTSSSDTTYEMLNKKIEHLMSEIEKNHSTGSIFKDLIEKIKEFKEKAVETIKK